MVKIWGRKTSINVQKVMWAVAKLGLAHERVDVGGPFGGLDSDEFGTINPNRLVPALQDEGVNLWESNAIIRYLAAKYDHGGLAPSDPVSHGQADQWMDWSITTFYGELIVGIFLPLIRTTKAERDEAAVAASVERAGQKLSVADRQLAGRDYLLGDQLSMADIAVGTLMYRYYTLDIARPDLANVAAWYGRLCARPAYVEHVMIPFDDMRVPGA